MIDFIVLGLPRSGTTWCANWLTTDRSYCHHDASAYTLDLDSLGVPGRITGLADTGLGNWPDVVNAYHARKIVIDRDPQECLASTSRLLCVERAEIGSLEGVQNAIHFKFKSLFEERSAKTIYQYLTGLKFDVERWKLLKTFYVSPYDAEMIHRAGGVQYAMSNVESMFSKVR